MQPFFARLVTFLAIKQNDNEVKMKLNLARHILYLPKIPRFIKVVLLCHFQSMLFIFVLFCFNCDSKYFVVRECNNALYTQPFDTTRGGWGKIFKMGLCSALIML